MMWKEKKRAARNQTIDALTGDDNAEHCDWSESDVEDADAEEGQIFHWSLQELHGEMLW